MPWIKLPWFYICFATHAVQGISSTLFHYFFLPECIIWQFWENNTDGQISSGAFKPSPWLENRTILSELQPFQICFLFVIHQNSPLNSPAIGLLIIVGGSFTLTLKMHIIIWLNNFDHHNMTIMEKSHKCIAELRTFQTVPLVRKIRPLLSELQLIFCFYHLLARKICPNCQNYSVQ